MESNTSAWNNICNFSWADVNWNALRRLRTRFLQFDPRGEADAPDRADYWRAHSELASYDFTFAERIGWKWDTVLAELKTRGWSPPEGTVLDWGCGTGVAGRRVAQAWPGQIRRLALHDRSVPAQRFAAERARKILHDISVETGIPSAPDVLVLSHVLNELTPDALERLLALAAQAQAVLWVEPGTAPVSRQLIALRERLAPQFRVIAPCPPCSAGGPCGMQAPGNERHWCHHLARVPGHVHTDPGWGRFAQALELDLGRVPFSYLVLDRRSAGTGLPGNARVIGEPRYYKGFAKVLACQVGEVRELILQKRDAPELFKTIKKAPGSLYQWERDGEKIRGGEQVF